RRRRHRQRAGRRRGVEHDDPGRARPARHRRRLWKPGDRPMSTPDVITTAVVQSGLVAAAKEMSTTLERAAYNPLLFELKDYSAAIVNGDGRLWAEAPGLIAFLSSIPDLVQVGLDKHRDALEPGDVLIANDPFTTGTHVSDTTIYMPVFAEGELVALT